MFRFEELEIWKLAIEYANEIYDLSEKLPGEERYNVVDQLRRAALSISNNIAEGSATSTTKNFCLFLDRSIGSALETVNLLHFSRKRNYISEVQQSELYNKAEIIIKKIRSFKNSLKS
ncbi:MAG: four helix bundle protein [Candidatus Omnitrophica bacterium]|nr:four helix bundle protein [Candidatus Omnitrophota bacterium]